MRRLLVILAALAALLAVSAAASGDTPWRTESAPGPKPCDQANAASVSIKPDGIALDQIDWQNELNCLGAKPGRVAYQLTTIELQYGGTIDQPKPWRAVEGGGSADVFPPHHNGVLLQNSGVFYIGGWPYSGCDDGPPVHWCSLYRVVAGFVTDVPGSDHQRAVALASDTIGMPFGPPPGATR